MPKPYTKQQLDDMKAIQRLQKELESVHRRKEELQKKKFMDHISKEMKSGFPQSRSPSSPRVPPVRSPRKKKNT